MQKDTGCIKSHRRSGRFLTHERPLIINPTLDHVWVDYWMMYRENLAPAYNLAPKCFDSIKTLEVRHVHWDGLIHTYEGPEDVDYFLQYDGGIFQFFKNLETVHFVSDRGLQRKDMIAAFDQVKQVVKTEMVEGLLGENRIVILEDGSRDNQLCPGAKAPRVVFHSCKSEFPWYVPDL